jgi:oligopeptidase B
MGTQRLVSRRYFTRSLGAAVFAPAAMKWAMPAAAGATAMRRALVTHAIPPVTPPVAPVIPEAFEAFGRRRVDNYNWLRNRENPNVATYLQAENAYADTRLEAIKPLVEELAAELKARTADKDATVPAVQNGYVYERRYEPGATYPLIVRRKDAPGAADEVVLDVGALAADAFAAGRLQYRLGYWTVSPDNARVAFVVDFTGNLEYRIFVRTIATGEVADQGIADAASNLVFSADGRVLFYVRNEPETLRSSQVWRHRIGGDAGDDVLVYEEHDPTFSVSVDLSKSRKFILLGIDEERSGEIRYLRTDQPLEQFKIIEPRRAGVRYEVDHVGDRFFIHTNLDAPDYRLMTAPDATPDAAHWSEIVPQAPGRHLAHYEAFETFVAADFEDERGMTIRLFSLPEGREIPLPRPAEVGVASSYFEDSNSANLDASSKVLRFHFSGPLNPPSVYDFDTADGTLTLRKQDAANRWFDPNSYALDRLNAVAPDGEHVPVTLVYRKELRRRGGNPALLVGYGAYGVSFRPTFTAHAFSLVDRGFIYAIAHVRGGQEKGDRWYEEGRMLMKRNSFTDFIAATEALVAEGYADPNAVFAQGASAGGLLVGAVSNLRPDLYAGIVAEVPFVDVITTMSDASVPLTTLEYDEWGNPAVESEFDYMLSYSPYDNVGRKNYPAMFVTAGYYDSQVSYAEPAKWVALLRASKTDNHDLLFKTEMDAGHGGRSGRFGSIGENAEIMGWLIVHARNGQLP